MTKSHGDKQSRFFYLDVLRVISIFAVIILHNAADAVNLYGKIPAIDWSFACIYNGLTRFCVPMFVLISGSLLLDKNKPTSISELFKKRLPKLLIPLVVWTVVYELHQNFIFHTFNKFSLKDTLVSFYQGAGPVVFHFWFLYMMIGIYLVYPILNLFVASATRKQVEYFLAVWFVFTCVIGTIEILTQTYIGLDFGAFAGYTGYFVLGYYLRSFECEKQTLNILYGAGIAAFLISVGGIFLLKIYNVQHGNDIIESDTTPEIPFALAGLFLFFKNYTFSASKRWHNLVSDISFDSYGIYIVHVLIMRILFDNLGLGVYFDKPGIALSVPLKTIVILILAYLFTKLLKRIPLIKLTV